MKCVVRVLLFLGAASLVWAAPAFAHPVPFSYLDVQLRDGFVDVSLVVHIFDVAHDLQLAPMERLLEQAEVAAQVAAIRSLLLPRLELTADGRKLQPEWLEPEILADRQSLRLHLRYSVADPPGVIAVTTLMFPYDPQHQTFVNMYEADDLASQFILDRARTQVEYYVGTRQGVWAVIRKFIPAGIHHILIGPDHLLFLVGLLLLGGTLRRLGLMVTSFTVAHSITLALAALNILNPPARVVEPLIALSIVYVGIDNLLQQDGRGRDVRVWIALAFGFIHGFGFAGVLREMGLPDRALGWSLFSFNLGVEIGQLLVVVLVGSALGLMRSRSELAGRRIAFAGSILVISAGTFWFVQRVFFAGGV